MLPIKKILCPVDFSELSLHAMAVAIEMAATFGSELHLLHAFEGYDEISLSPETALTPLPQWLVKLRQVCLEKLSELPGPDHAAKCSAVVRAFREGPAIPEILSYADQHKIELIVLATHGRTGIKHLLMGSVAENVVRGAKCPVLTIRGGEPVKT